MQIHGSHFLFLCAPIAGPHLLIQVAIGTKLAEIAGAIHPPASNSATLWPPPI